MRVLLVGAPTALIDKYEHVMTLSGLSISSLETELLSVARVASPLCADQKDPARIIPTLCISMGAMSTSLALLRDGGITFAYTTPTGGSALTRAIASDFGFSLNQAEAYKKTYGISDGEIGVKLRKAIDPIIESIITEIKKAINTHNEQFGSDPLQQILLSGGAAKLPGLTHVLTSTLGHETVLLDPWKSLEGYAQLPKEMRDDAPDYAIAVGLALREEHE
jgi:type IV pilus assembly protein PilM